MLLPTKLVAQEAASQVLELDMSNSTYLFSMA